MLFTGREYNAETGDYYFRARSMHPMVGRFMQKDSLMFFDGMNDYSYVTNKVTKYLDSFGLCKQYSQPEKHCIFGVCIWSSHCLDGHSLNWPNFPTKQPRRKRPKKCPNEEGENLCDKLARTQNNGEYYSYYKNLCYQSHLGENDPNDDYGQKGKWYNKDGRPHFWYVNGLNKYLGPRPW